MRNVLLALPILAAGCAEPAGVFPVHIAGVNDPATMPAAQAVGAWRVGCRDDATRAERTCTATRVDPLSAGMEERVSVAYIRRAGGAITGPFIYPAEPHDCRGWERILRVDGNAPVGVAYPYGAAGVAAMGRVARQMEAGTFLRSESRAWPRCSAARGAMVRIEGFGPAHAALRQRIGAP